MTSQKKIAANRQNATRSTGPRTASGKARSRTNALRHGILSQALPSAEHAASMDELARRIAREHGKPENAIEAKIVAETEMTILKTRTHRATLFNAILTDNNNLPDADRTLQLLALNRYEQRAILRRQNALRQIRQLDSPALRRG
jgi:hypothetical protein